MTRFSSDLLDSWGDIAVRLASTPGLGILIDDDGTPTPRSAVRLLGALAEHPRTVVGMVSGRRLRELVPRVGLDRLWYVGCHGYEIRTPAGEERRAFSPQDIRYVDSVEGEVGREIGAVDGVILERKGPILAVHYRDVALPRVSEIQRAVLRTLHRHGERVHLMPGAHRLELRLSRSCPLGQAVREIRGALPAGSLVLAFGAPFADREVLRELRPDGLSIEIGAVTARRADFSLEQPAAVIETLRRVERLLRMRERRGRAPGERETPARRLDSPGKAR